MKVKRALDVVRDISVGRLRLVEEQGGMIWADAGTLVGRKWQGCLSLELKLISLVSLTSDVSCCCCIFFPRTVRKGREGCMVI